MSIIINKLSGNIKKDIYKNNGTLIGDSNSNKYIPYFALYDNEVYQDCFGYNTIIYAPEYIKTNYSYTSIKSYNLLLYHFLNNFYMRMFNIKKGTDDYIYSNKGIIMDRNNRVLICLAVDSSIVNNKEFLSDSIENTLLSKDNVKLFLSRELLINSIYKTFYNKFLTLLLKNYMPLNINFEYVNNIEEHLFKNSYRKPNIKQLNKILDYQEYIKNIFNRNYEKQIKNRKN